MMPTEIFRLYLQIVSLENVNISPLEKLKTIDQD